MRRFEDTREETLTDEQLIEQAGYILSAMAGNYPSESSVHMDTDATEPVATESVATEPVDTESVDTESVATEGNVNITDILTEIQNSANLAGQVKIQSLKQLSSWVNTVFSIGDKTKELLISFKSDSTEVIAEYNDKYETFKSTINDAYRKIEGNVESGLETIGLKEQLDNIMLQHEKMLFIAMQLCYSKIGQGDLLLEPNSEDIPRKVNAILTSEHKGQLMIHVRKLFETFYNRKLGISAVNSHNIVKSESTVEGDYQGSATFVKRSNTDLIEMYNNTAVQETIDNTVENPDNLTHFLIHFIKHFKNDGKVNDFDHAKYFGYSQTLPDFVESIIGLNESNINFIDYKLSKESIKTRLDYYANIIKSGDTLRNEDTSGKIYKLYTDYATLINDTIGFINSAKSEDFDNVEGDKFDLVKDAAKGKADKILEELKKDHKKFVGDLIKEDGPINVMNAKLNVVGQKRTGPLHELNEALENIDNLHGNEQVEGAMGPPLPPQPGPGGGRKRKHRRKSALQEK